MLNDEEWKLHYQYTRTTRSLAFVMQSMQHIVLYDFFFFMYIIDMCIIDQTSFYYPLINSYKLLSQAKPLQRQKLAKNLENYFLMIIYILYIKLVIPMSVSQNFRKMNTKTVLISCDENT